MPKPRNPFVLHPLMRKGGEHVKSKTGVRTQNKHSLDDEADECRHEREHGEKETGQPQTDKPD